MESPFTMLTRTEYFSAIAEDVIRVTKVERSLLDNALGELRERTSFLSGDQAAKLFEKHISNLESREAIRNLIFALHDWINESEVSIQDLGDSLKTAWKRSHDRDQAELVDVDFDACLKALAGPFPAIERQANAVRVSKIAGNRANAISFVNDLRPVYRQPERDQIEGMIPLTTMVVDSVNPSGNESHLEVVLSMTELDKLITNAQTAQKKIAQLVDFARAAGKEVPELGLTKSSGGEG